MQIDGKNLLVLLRKDVRMQWVPALVLLVFEVLTFLSFEAQFPDPMRVSAGAFLQSVASIGTFVMAYRVLATEEASGAIKFLKSLPFTNDEIFFSKFVFVTGYVIVNAVSLNLVFLLLREVLPWTMDPVTVKAVLVGFVVQFLFAFILVAIATLANSEKAIWVPFPVVILLLNAYTLLTSDDGSGQFGGVFEELDRNWGLYGAGVVVLALLLCLVVVRRTRARKVLFS